MPSNNAFGRLHMRYRYLPMTDVDDDGFGIAVLEEYGDETTVIESFADLTDDEMSVDRLAEMCNSLELDPAHLCDVVEDFLASL